MVHSTLEESLEWRSLRIRGMSKHLYLSFIDVFADLYKEQKDAEKDADKDAKIPADSNPPNCTIDPDMLGNAMTCAKEAVTLIFLPSG